MIDPTALLELFSRPETWIALGTLTTLEIVLGIDNIVFISILANNLPEDEQPRARQTGLALALIGRIILLLSITWVMQLTAPLFTLPLADVVISGRDLILCTGGFFLIGKSTHEIHNKLEGPDQTAGGPTKAQTFASVITQIFLLDLVFSLDSVITAVGMADDVEVMIVAVVIAIVVMMVSAEAVSEFIGRHPTVKMLALSFLLLIGVTLVAEGFGQHIPKGYIYSAMGFSLLVEMLNLGAYRGEDEEPVHLHETRLQDAAPDLDASTTAATPPSERS
jgi:predicted tellurium resistance membrane protein TerC